MDNQLEKVSDFVFGAINTIELLLFLAAGALLIYFLFRKLKKEKTENFEKRDN